MSEAAKTGALAAILAVVVAAIVVLVTGGGSRPLPSGQPTALVAAASTTAAAPVSPTVGPPLTADSGIGLSTPPGTTYTPPPGVATPTAIPASVTGPGDAARMVPAQLAAFLQPPAAAPAGAASPPAATVTDCPTALAGRQPATVAAYCTTLTALTSAIAGMLPPPIPKAPAEGAAAGTVILGRLLCTYVPTGAICPTLTG